MRFKKIVIIPIVLIVISFAVVNITRTHRKDEGVKYLVGVSQPNISDPCRVALIKQIQLYGERHADVKVIYYDAANDDIRQKKDIVNMMEQKIDLLIVTPRSPDFLSETINEIFDSGISVILLENKAEDTNYTMFISVADYKPGKALEEHTAKMLGSKAFINALKILKGEAYPKTYELSVR